MENWIRIAKKSNYLAVLLIGSLLVLQNLSFGYSSDLDSMFVIQKSMQFLHRGYLPSRSWGFPLYEFAIYPLIALFGIESAKIYSLILYLGTILIFHLIIQTIERNLYTQFISTLAWAVSPLAVISGNTILETSQGVFLALLGLYFFVKSVKNSKKKTLLLLLGCVSLGFATATRPDYFIFSASLLIAYFFTQRVSVQFVLVLSTTWLASAIFPFLIYSEWNPTLAVILPDPIIAKILRAGLGFLIFLGLPAWAVLGYWLLTSLFSKARHLENWLSSIRKEWFYLFLFMVTILYLIRFILLPDELEYLIIMLPVIIITLVYIKTPNKILTLFAIALFIPNFLQIHLFSSDTAGNLSVNPGISQGIIVQERNMRLRLEYFQNTILPMINELAVLKGYKDYFYLPSNEPNILVVIPEDQLRFYNNSTLHGNNYGIVRCKQKIITYPFYTYRGWRQSIKWQEWRPLTLEDFKEYTPSECNSTLD